MTDITADEYRTAAKVDRFHGGQSAAQFYEDNARALEVVEADEADSFEFLNELALAFRAAENHPRPEYAPVLEGVRAVLAHLQSAGRLLADDEQRLTAEQVEDVRALVWLDGRRNFDAFRRLRALFPATEPAEDAKPCGSNSVTLGWCKLTARHEGLHTNGTYLWGTPSEPDPPAPAEPAEEETKAERDSQGIIRINGGRIVALSRDPRELVQQWYDLAEPGSKWQRDYAAALDLFDREATSSPVVPAPTETGPQTLEGPWDRIEDVPETVGRLTDRDGDIWEWDGDNWVTPETAILPTTYINRKYAPFVAAEGN